MSYSDYHTSGDRLKNFTQAEPGIVPVVYAQFGISDLLWTSQALLAIVTRQFTSVIKQEQALNGHDNHTKQGRTDQKKYANQPQGRRLTIGKGYNYLPEMTD